MKTLVIPEGIQVLKTNKVSVSLNILGNSLEEIKLPESIEEIGGRV